MNTDVLVTPLTIADLSANLSLAQAVGWADTEPAWRVLHEAACVLGIRRQGTLVAQGALGLYEGAGTIAKMIVLPAAQRQGLGARVLDALLAEAQARGLNVLGLAATPSGRPLYESRGFVANDDIVVLTGEPHRSQLGEERLPNATLATAVAVEERFIRCSRRNLLAACLRAPAASAELVKEGINHGYGLATAQGTSSLIGPVLADNEDTARALTSSLFLGCAGPVRIDVPVRHAAFRKWLVGLGLRELGVRPEMVRGATQLPWQVNERFALATQAWG